MHVTDGADADGPRDLGVVLVHGIGRHRKGQVLAAWGDALVSWMQLHGSGDDVHADSSLAARVVSTRLNRDSDDPAHADVEVIVGGRYRRWLLVESWWAASFVPPTFAELVSWSLWTFPVTLLFHVAGRTHADVGREGPSSRIAARVTRTAGAVVTAIPGLALAPLVVLGLLGILLLGAMPVGSLRRLAARAQRTLAQTVGDSLVLLDRPMQSAAILDRVRRDIRWAARRCDNVVVLAHSQGAAIALEALHAAAGVEPGGTPAAWQLGDPGPRALLTFGSGANKLFGLRRIRAAVARGARGVRPWTGSAYLYGLAFAGAVVWHQILIGSTQWADVAGTVLGVAAGVGATLLALRVGAWATDLSWIAARTWARALVAVVALGAALATNVTIVGVGTQPFVQVGAVSALMVTVWTSATLRAIDRSVDIDVPHGVDVWIDIHASRDPVPGGPSTIHARQLRRRDPLSYRNQLREDRNAVDIAITNTASVFRDHSWYWKNGETFIPTVVRELAVFSFRRAEEVRPDLLMFLPLVAWAPDRRRRRIRWLIVGRAAVLVAATTYVLWRWRRLAGYGRQLHRWGLGLPSWLLPWTDDVATTTVDRSVATTLGLLAITAVTLVGYLVVVATWTILDTQMQREAHGGPRRPAWSAVPFAVAMAIIFAAVPLGEATATWLAHLASSDVGASAATVLGMPLGWVWLHVVVIAAAIGWLPWLDAPRSR